MCTDAEKVPGPSTDVQPAAGTTLTRRGLLKAAGGSAALGLLVGPWVRQASALAASPAGLLPFSMAMHVHSSFSEQSGSMDSQLFQARSNGVNVLWWTDHDYRMEGVHYRNAVHFTSLTAETTDGAAWQWLREDSGPLAAGSGGSVVATPASPNDPVVGGSLSLRAQSTSSTTAAVRFFAESHPAGWNYHRNLFGQTLTIDVLPTQVGTSGYLELALKTSYHQASGGRPAGLYSLSYRFGGPGAPGTRSTEGLVGIVNVGVLPGVWNTVNLTPCYDIGALWPEMAMTDFASFELRLGAVSLGPLTTGCFDYLRFTRNFVSGDIPLQTQQALTARYASVYPTVAARQGLEISEFLPHVNWFGGAVDLPDYTDVDYPNWQAFLGQQVVKVHANGGLASYNHPFGYTAAAALPKATQDALRLSVAKLLLGNRAMGCDILEVGYPLRSGVDLGHHVGLWDVLSRNGRFMTGNGVTDDHFGQNWYGIKNNWITSVWAPSVAEADLLGALAAGRAWSASLPRYRGSMDLLVDGSAPMGSVTVSTAGTRTVHLVATAMPTGSTLQVLRGTVDYAGAANAVPNATVVRTYAATALASGAVDYVVDTSASRFLRTQVVGADGVLIAASNPVWMLRSAPPGGIPEPRAA